MERTERYGRHRLKISFEDVLEDDHEYDRSRKANTPPDNCNDGYESTCRFMNEMNKKQEQKIIKGEPK